MKKLLKFTIKLVFFLALFSVGQVVAFKWLPVWYTPLMVKRCIEFRDDSTYRFQRHWKNIDAISENLIKASIASEDNLFATHQGFDIKAIEDELEKSRQTGKKARGCSTISQQTAKNVFTLADRSFLRKGVEAYYTFLIEKIWGKKRIMEVYLNVAEMGKGIFGAEAAAQAYYKKTASKLTLSESALLVACYPNPLQRSPARPTNYLVKRQGQITSLVPKLSFKFLEEWKEDKKDGQ